MKKTRIVNVRLDEDTYTRLKSLADHSGTSLSKVIRRHLEAPKFNVTVGPGLLTTTWPSTFRATSTWKGWAA
jgi:hypothetical protein